MNFNVLLLFAILLLGQSKSDDYFLNEEEEQQTNFQDSPENNRQFLRDFACLIGTNKYMNENQAEFEKFKGQRSFGLNWKRLRIQLFKVCTNEVSDEIVDQVNRARTSEDFLHIDYPFYQNFDHDQILESQESRLNEDEKEFAKRLKDIEDKIKEMQKNHQRQNPEAETGDDEDQDTWEGIRGQKSSPEIFFADVGNKAIIYIAFGMVLALICVLFCIWKQLFKKDNQKKKDMKKELKKQKKFIPNNQNNQLPKNFYKAPMPARYQVN